MFEQIRESLYSFLYGYKSDLPSRESLIKLTSLECEELIDIIISNTEKSIFTSQSEPSLIETLKELSKFLCFLNGIKENDVDHRMRYHPQGDKQIQ